MAVEDEDYFTARETLATNATTTRREMAMSESPSIASPFKPRKITSRERGQEERKRTQKGGQERMRRTTRRDWETLLGDATTDTQGHT